MRLVKCSREDEEFTSEEDALHFFRQALWDKGGRFGFGYGNQIGPTPESLSAGETVLFQYEGKIRFVAKAISGRLDGTEGEHYFLVELNSLYETEWIPYTELERRFRLEAGLQKALGGQAWTKIPSNDLTEAVVRSLIVRKVENPNSSPGKVKQNEEGEFFLNATDAISGRQVGQGFQKDLLKRQIVEQYAMQRAIEFYGDKLGADSGTVSDVSKDNPFDLLCLDSRDGETRVEVKGTTGSGEQIFLTRNEVENAKNYREVDLFIVCNIELIEENGELIATGGDVRVAHQWRPSDECLETLSYRYKVPGDLFL